jgi:outer membrane protein OmpA-like peptidoglycan-associated protein
MIVIILCVGLLCLGGMTHLLKAQDRQMTDLRERSYTADELGQLLFPMQTRGLPKPGTTPPAETSVALDLLFPFNSAVILPKYHDTLNKLGTVLTAPQYTAYHIQIEGHTDAVGSEIYNQTLSEQRAASVKDYLVQQFHVDPSRLTVKGMGETKPVMSNDTEAGRSKNRRVEIVNTGP